MRFSNGSLLLLAAAALVGCSSGSGGGGITPIAPTITWATPASVPVGTALSSVQLDATASVAGSFSYTPAAGTVMNTVGTTTLMTTFTPTDTVHYTTATGQVTLTVTAITPIAPTITWATPASVPVGTALSSVQLDATASVAGSFSYTPAAGTVMNTVGATTLMATFTPTDTVHYTTATGQVTLTVTHLSTPITPTITWATPASVTVGTALSSVQLDATASVAGSFSYTPAAGTVMNTVGTTTLMVTFTPTDTTDYTTATGQVTLTVTAQIAGTAYVNFATTYQTIRGFGGSTAWLGQLTTAQANALYSPSSGLGLSVLRVRIDPTGTAASNWVPSNGSWLTEVTNAQEAVSANPNAIVFASPWTPPPSMKTSSTSQPYYSGASPCSPGTGYCGGYLNPSSYAAYAAYLEDFVTYFNANSSFNLYAISMQNEPDWSAQPTENYESCSWTAAQMDTWIANNASVLTAKLIMPESLNFNPAQALTALNDPNAVDKIGIVAGHLYGTAPAAYPLAEQDGKDLWETEHYIQPAGSQPTITDALVAAEEVHNSMVTGNYNAYVWWWIWDDPSDGVNIGLINSNTTSPTPTYYGYALGQFAKFIQPGYVRVSATATPVAGVYVSAYSGSGHSVIVAINANTSAVSLPIAIQNQTVTSMTPYQTTAAGGMTALTAVSVSGDAFTYSLPAQSITTFVQ
jgi:glucuronoarabinoxylan endo-1,4-beta-xylanase